MHTKQRWKKLLGSTDPFRATVFIICKNQRFRKNYEKNKPMHSQELNRTLVEVTNDKKKG